MSISGTFAATTGIILAEQYNIVILSGMVYYFDNDFLLWKQLLYMIKRVRISIYGSFISFVNRGYEWLLQIVWELCCGNYSIYASAQGDTFPLSVWGQKKSIKMDKMQPNINYIYADYFGDKDRIAEETSRLYKREKYHPMASAIPM